jgi:hypothetical protein
MSKPSLHDYYLSLISNLVSELFFFIPKDEIREDIIEKLDFLKTTDIFNKAYVIDYYQGPMEYKKGRSNKHLLLKESYLERNMFSLLEKKSDVKSYEFNYVLEKYFELTECLFYITNWMNINSKQLNKYDEAISGIFYFQSLNYKKHFETLIKNFYPSKDIIPKGNFNALKLIETYFPDILTQYNKPKQISQTIPTAIEEQQDKSNLLQRKAKKQPLITDDEAESVLMKNIFNLDTKAFK